MAKELPYFKFEPNEWQSGMIQLCSLQAKGLFLELCCLYWSRLGELPYALALQKLCNGGAKLLDELEKNQIYDIESDKIIIKFLDEQLNEFNRVGEKRRKAANKRWNNANALQKQSKSNAIREDKIREEEKRQEGENKILPPLEILEQKKDEDLQEWFLNWFNKHRTRLLEIPSNFKKLQSNDIYNLTKLNNTYNEKDFESALKSICMDKWACENDLVIPKHFLNEDNFIKYLNATPKTHMSREQKKRKGWTV